MSEAPLFYDSLPEPGTVMTTADYLRTPESNCVHELWRGVFRVEESPTSWHQDLAFEIAIALRAHVKPKGLGKVWVAPLDVILDHDRAIVVQPDVVFVSHRRLDIVTDKVRGAPDLVVEVLSPLPRIGTLTERVECFATNGVRECWLVDQRTRTIEVLTFEDGRGAHRVAVAGSQPVPSRLLAGLQFRLEDAIG